MSGYIVNEQTEVNPWGHPFTLPFSPQTCNRFQYPNIWLYKVGLELSSFRNPDDDDTANKIFPENNPCPRAVKMSRCANLSFLLLWCQEPSSRVDTVTGHHHVGGSWEYCKVMINALHRKSVTISRYLAAIKVFSFLIAQWLFVILSRNIFMKTPIVSGVKPLILVGKLFRQDWIRLV